MRSPKLLADEIECLKTRIVLWLRDQMETAGKAGYVVGVSGGIDSAVCSLLVDEACRSSGDKTFMPLCLPISVEGIQDGRDMRSFFSRYGISAKFHDLTDAYEAFMRALPEQQDVFTIATIKHRIRMNVVYTYAKRRDLLVASTINKIEYSTGYFPKHAGLGDVLPQADLRKSDIRAIARLYDIPAELTMQKASGCIEGSTAEDEWGFTEDDGDAMVEHVYDDDGGTLDLSSEKTQRFSAMREDTHHKRGFPPLFRVGDTQ